MLGIAKIIFKAYGKTRHIYNIFHIQVYCTYLNQHFTEYFSYIISIEYLLTITMIVKICLLSKGLCLKISLT